MKKNYMQPCVEATQLQMSTIVLAGSPGVLNNNGSNTSEIGDEEIIGG